MCSLTLQSLSFTKCLQAPGEYFFFYEHCFSQHAECDFCVRNKESLTPLHLACLNGNVHIVDLIVRKVSDDNKAAALSAEGWNYYSDLFYCFNSMMSFPFPCPKYIRYASSNTSTLCCKIQLC